MPALDLTAPTAVADALTAGANANRDATCRHATIDPSYAPRHPTTPADPHDGPHAQAPRTYTGWDSA